MTTLAVYFKDQQCGTLSEEKDKTYLFTYSPEYLATPGARPISVNLPLQTEPYYSASLFPFFDNLISEGWLLEAQTTIHKIDRRNRFALIQKCGIECMGAVSLRGQHAD